MKRDGRDELHMRAIRIVCGLLCMVPRATVAQSTWPEAPEKWSQPEKVTFPGVEGFHYATDPTLTGDGKTMYLFYYSHTEGSGIYRSVLTDSGWSHPVRLPDRITGGLTEGPSISPDGKRLFFRNYDRFPNYGGWDLFATDWDASANDWGPVYNLGPGVNTDRDDWNCYSPDSMHLFWNWFGSTPRLSLWNPVTQAWDTSAWLDDWRLSPVEGGIAVPQGRRKLYHGSFTETANPFDIYVTYFDSLSGRWSNSMVLNLNAAMDSTTTVPPPPESAKRIQANPWISPDGRIMYFTSDHDSTFDIWMSRLIIDENGNPVAKINRAPESSPQSFFIMDPYPNPFNSTVTIEYEMSPGAAFTLSVENLLGQRVRTISLQEASEGTGRITWDARDDWGRQVSSGLYFIVGRFEGDRALKKVLLLR
jgi:hypothetical protein